MNTNNETIVHSKRLLVQALACCPWLSKILYAASDIPIAPCQFPFNVSSKDSVLNAVFRTVEHRNFYFILQFHYKDEHDADRVRDLVGDGGYKVYTRESADTDHPVPVITKTKEDVQLYQQRISTGEFVTRPTDLSGVVPIHIRVSKEESESDSILLEDKTVRTLAYFAHGFHDSDDGGRYDRMVMVLALKPGLYRVQVNTIQESPRFSGVTTKFAITYHSKTSTIKD